MINDTVSVTPTVDYPAPLAAARQSFTNLLRTNPADTAEIDPADFADALAQTTVFGFLLARIEAGDDVDPGSAHAALDSIRHPFLKNTLWGLNAPVPEMETLLKGPLRAACDMVNRAAPRLAGPDGDWTRVTYVYEEFFSAYRPTDRFKFGVFYTPMEVTRYQVGEVRRVLTEDLGLTGLTDPGVRFLDPACGTGTYLVALAEGVAAEATANGMPVATVLREFFSERVAGFEVSPGPASVAQARLASWLHSHGVTISERFPVYTVNTLSPPLDQVGQATGNLWSDNVTAEQAAGDRVKAETPVLVVLGNPPWGRRDRHEFDMPEGGNQIASWAVGASGAAQSLYDLYVAFWRFACNLLLERPDVQPARGVVSFITNRTWLRGRPFTGMRSYMRDAEVDIYVTDLGGDSRASEVAKDQPVFAIRAGSAVATAVFGAANGTRTNYRRVLGTRAEKLKALVDTDPDWREGPVGGNEPFALVDWGLLEDAPPVRSFFARSMPGVKTHRDDLVVGESRDQLTSRLVSWNGMREAQRRERFHESRGRAMPAASYAVDQDQVIAYRYRPLDNRYLYADRRFIQEPGRISTMFSTSPHLRCLQFLESATTGGPAVIATNALPDYHSVRGSYGCHVVPLESGTDSAAFDLGAAELLSPWAQSWASGLGLSVVEVGCYILALANAPSYVPLFGDGVISDPPRFPAATDASLIADAVEVGERLLVAWCLKAPPLGTWHQVAPTGTPLGTATMQEGTVRFVNGDSISGLHPRSKQLEVSTYAVVERWLAAREDQPLTSSLATEFRLVAGAVSVILAARDPCDELLARSLESEMLTVDELRA
jgi:hypothetical protein